MCMVTHVVIRPRVVGFGGPQPGTLFKGHTGLVIVGGYEVGVSPLASGPNECVCSGAI